MVVYSVHSIFEFVLSDVLMEDCCCFACVPILPLSIECTDCKSEVGECGAEFCDVASAICNPIILLLAVLK